MILVDVVRLTSGWHETSNPAARTVSGSAPVWIGLVAALLGAVVGAQLNARHSRRAELRRAAVLHRRLLFAELDPMYRSSTHSIVAGLDDERRDRVELSLIEIGLDAWTTYDVLHLIAMHERDRETLGKAVDFTTGRIDAAVVQRNSAYRDAVYALTRYLDGERGRRWAIRHLRRARNRCDTSRALSRRTRRWAKGQQAAIDDAKAKRANDHEQ